jgi:hypothetical protein
LREVKKHFAGYAKGHEGIYGHLEAKLEAAITHADRLMKHNASTGSFNPSTAMHDLVDYLRKLKQ